MSHLKINTYPKKYQKTFVVKKRIRNLEIILVSIFILFFNGCNQKTVIYNTGTNDYTKIFQEAVSNSEHIIIESGSYRLTAPIYLHSKIVIEGEGEVILVKDTLYSQVFINQQAIKDHSDLWDTSITIKNLIIDVNKKGKQSDSVHSTSNGILSFKYLNNLTLRNIKIVAGDSTLFGVHLQSVKNVLVRDYYYEGDKDGFHINGGCENIYITEFDISSLDDAFGIMTDDYPRVQHNAKDIKNIVIKNGVSRKRNPQCGYFLRLITGSWDDWKKGNKYNIGNTVNSGNRQYKKLNKGESVSLDCPCHLSGDRLYSDGIIWRYIGEGVNKTSNIYNISISNVKLDDGRKIVRTINADSNDYGEYSGTENMSVVDGVFIESHRLNISRGRVGLWKTIPNRDYISLAIIMLCLLLLTLIVIYYFRIKRKISYLVTFRRFWKY